MAALGRGEPAMEEISERHAQLRAELAAHDVRYYVDGRPTISDAEYDRLQEDLVRLEAGSPERKANETGPLPFGDDRTGRFPEVRHRVPMGGLEKSYRDDDLRRFHARVEGELEVRNPTFVIEPKVDGLAISVTYEGGRMTRAITRGNGISGDDITANVKRIKGLPEVLLTADGETPDVVELRGEIFMTFEAFERLNAERREEGLAQFAHPRSAAAGTARLSDPAIVAGRNLSIVFFGWGAWTPAVDRPVSQRAFRKQLQDWRLPVLESAHTARGIEAVREAVRSLEDNRHLLSFATDGAVVKVDSVSHQEILGSGSSGPRWATAWKFPSERKKTRVLGITLQVGRTGLLTPVAELEPVTIGGTRVARVTLHNPGWLARKDVRIGDHVEIEKSGQVIPSLVGVDKTLRPSGSEPYAFPDACPACGKRIERTPRSKRVWCSGGSCPGQVRKRLVHFASRACMDIREIGPELIGRLFDAGRLTDIGGFYRLEKEDLLALGENEATARNVIAAIENSREADLWRCLYGLSIRGVGAGTARLLAEEFGSLGEFADFVAAPEVSRTRNTRLASRSIEQVRDHFADAGNRAVLAELVAAEIGKVVQAGETAP